MAEVVVSSHSTNRVLAVAALLALSVFGVSYIFSTGYLGSAYPIRPNWLRQCVFLISLG